MNETNLINEKHSFSLTFKYSPLLFILDQILRIAILTAYLYYEFSTWLFLLGQLFIFGITVPISNKIVGSIKNKYRKFVNPQYESLNAEIDIVANIPSKLVGYQLFIGYAFSLWFFYYIFDNHLWYHYIFIVFLALFGLVPFMMILVLTPKYRVSKKAQSIKIINTKTVYSEQKNKNIPLVVDETSKYPNFLLQGLIFEPDAIDFDTVDLNDTKIAKLESELKSTNYKTDAWLLESVFLGGLAFSGFLTVASANFLGKEPEAFLLFITHLSNYLSSCSMDDFTSIYQNSSIYFSRNDLYIVIMLLCLLSSVFFLLILTLRFRLNSLSLNLDHIMRILTIFNAKEEELYNNSENFDRKPNQVERFKKIQKKIDIALIDAEKLLIKIRPVFIMMSIYRTIAIFLFYLVLILSGFYFMPIIAVTIFGLAIFTYLFRKIETSLNIDEIKNRVKRH